MKYLIILALFFALFASASWWDPFGWFQKDLICEPQIVEKIVEIPVEKIVEKTVEKPVEKVRYVQVPIEKIIEIPIGNSDIMRLQAEIAQWEIAFNEFKPEVYKLTTIDSYEELAEKYNRLINEYKELWLKTHPGAPYYEDIYAPAQEPSQCMFVVEINYPKGHIMCE